MDDILTPEQLYNKFIEIEERIDAGQYSGVPEVYKRRVLLLVFGQYLPQYNALSDEQKKDFGFDVDGLVKKVRNLLNGGN